jgi:hypothetical protein
MTVSAKGAVRLLDIFTSELCNRPLASPYDSSICRSFGAQPVLKHYLSLEPDPVVVGCLRPAVKGNCRLLVNVGKVSLDFQKMIVDVP